MESVVHFEMGYQDATRVMAFYSQVFGWELKLLGENMKNYITASTSETDSQGMVKNPGAINGGFYQTNDINSNSTTHVVIAVVDIKASSDKVVAAGGQLTSEQMNIPGIGLYVSFKDSEGNSVGMLQPSR